MDPRSDAPDEALPRDLSRPSPPVLPRPTRIASKVPEVTPLGAWFSDWTAVPRARSGLGWGDGPVSFVLLIAVVALVGFLTVARPDIDERGAGA